ncbi:MAG TPA: V-type ATP synthase subunit D [Burkholderiaceae bacterium]|nr:V-type ATP synthase subunit D [Burkholderiaceae bacterium]HRZ01658.1 V-type ATP synthase subunit D [Burkholderiaceae bacterium]
MSDIAPSRSVILELREERRAMADGHAFLDEKCLLLAGEILKNLARQNALRSQVQTLAEEAARALAAALARHGLEALQLHGPADLAGSQWHAATRMLMGVKLIDAEFVPVVRPPEGVLPSREVERVAEAYLTLTRSAATLGAVSANLERLAAEYRRAIRRARALHDVLLPELDAAVLDMETRLEDLEREDAIAMRLGAGAA